MKRGQPRDLDWSAALAHLERADPKLAPLIAEHDVLPTGDLGVREGMQRHFRLRALPEAARMEKLARPWAPYRSAASWYMWRLLE